MLRLLSDPSTRTREKKQTASTPKENINTRILYSVVSAQDKGENQDPSVYVSFRAPKHAHCHLNLSARSAPQAPFCECFGSKPPAPRSAGAPYRAGIEKARQGEPGRRETTRYHRGKGSRVVWEPLGTIRGLSATTRHSEGPGSSAGSS